MVRSRGLEPPRRFQRYHLKVVRLPIPPRPQFRPLDLELAKGLGDAQIREDADVSERSPERKRQIGQKPIQAANGGTHIIYMCASANDVQRGCQVHWAAAHNLGVERASRAIATESGRK